MMIIVSVPSQKPIRGVGISIKLYPMTPTQPISTLALNWNNNLLEIENQGSIILKEINPEFESIVDIKQETQKLNIESIKTKIKLEMICTAENWICKNSNVFLLNGDEDSISEEEMKQSNDQDIENKVQRSLKNRIPESKLTNNQRTLLEIFDEK